MRVNIVRESESSRSLRARQLESMFDVPATEKTRREWSGDFPFDAEPWQVGLIVGPSGCGKSTILREAFGEPDKLEWSAPSVIDDFDDSLGIEAITSACSAVGFNTIPAWLRPFGVLSNGERFRVELARRLLETRGTVVMDEFTSVVDRQVAQIGSHAVQKYVRRSGAQFVAASCHFDIIDWLQPDWVLEPSTMSFQRRAVQRRPSIDITIARIPSSAWSLFAPFHYMSRSLHRSATCFGLWANDELAAFCATLHFVHASVSDIRRISRVVTLPDWQGLGLAMMLVAELGAAYKAVGKRLRNYPAHPSFIRSHQRSPLWRQEKQAGASSTPGKTGNRNKGGTHRLGASFEYVGPPMQRQAAERLLGVA
jgi:ABC-type lipoprotein export system ATPase subunit/GNAT superfamily N-acetyltransferase